MAKGKLGLGKVEKSNLNRPCASNAGSEGPCRILKISEADPL